MRANAQRIAPIIALVASALTVGCDKPDSGTQTPAAGSDPSTSVPAGEDTATQAPDEATETAESAAPDETAGDDGEATDGAEGGEEAPTEAAPAAEEQAAEESAQGESSAAKSPLPAATAALPKPVHEQVDDSCGKGPGVGTKVKDFKLQTPGGKNISPSMFRGRVVLLNFWGTWCKPCLEELPEFDRLYRRYRKHGLSLVAVATDEDPTEVQSFLDKKKIAAKVAVGGESTASAYGARQFPFTFVVDAKGVIRGSYNGYKPKCMGKLEQDIRDELEKISKK